MDWPIQVSCCRSIDIYRDNAVWSKFIMVINEIILANMMIICMLIGVGAALYVKYKKEQKYLDDIKKKMDKFEKLNSS
jgi:predicted histidine transporter YuiF (NhaC family)